MFGGVVANAWKFELSYKIIRPFVQRQQQNGQPRPTNAQIRNQLHALPLKDFVFNVSIEWLKALEVERIVLAYASDIRRHFPVQPREQVRTAQRREEEEIMAIIRARKQTC